MAAVSENHVKRTLMTSDTIGGVWSFSLELAWALETFGVEVSLATMGCPLSADQRMDARRLPNLEIYESEYRIEWMRDPWDDVRAAGEWLLDLEQRVRPDIVHLNGYAHGALPWRAPVLISGHSCVCSWHTAVRESEAAENWDRYRNEVGRGLQCVDMVTAPSETMLSALRFHYGAFRAARPVYNARRPEEFPPGEKEPFILTAGRLWDEAKNLRLLAEAAPNVSWPVYAAGEYAHPEGVEANTRGIKFLGRLSQKELAGWMSRASIFVLPARYEPFGLCALEAGLAGCALALGDIPSLREIWGKTALFVPPDSPDALENAIRRLIENEDLRILLQKRARARALEFTPEIMGGEYMSLYGKLAADKTITARE